MIRNDIQDGLNTLAEACGRGMVLIFKHTLDAADLGHETSVPFGQSFRSQDECSIHFYEMDHCWPSKCRCPSGAYMCIHQTFCGSSRARQENPPVASVQSESNCWSLLRSLQMYPINYWQHTLSSKLLLRFFEILKTTWNKVGGSALICSRQGRWQQFTRGCFYTNFGLIVATANQPFDWSRKQ